MKKVTRDIFYATIGDLNAVLNTVGNWPYTTEYRLRNGTLKGKSVERISDQPDEYTVTDYYIS